MNQTSETKSTRIAKALEAMIMDNTLKTGTFLPSQQKLAEQFETSSRPIREALKLLEAKGLVTITQGRRAEVRSNNLDQYVGSLSTNLMNSPISTGKLMRNLMQVRVSVATSAAREFSRLENRGVFLAQLWKENNAMEASIPLMNKRDPQGLKMFQDAENNFHHILINANGNQILCSIYDNLSPMLVSALNSLKFTPTQLEKRSKDYTYLCEALENGQTDLAVALVLVILTNLENKVNDSFPDDLNIAYA